MRYGRSTSTISAGHHSRVRSRAFSRLVGLSFSLGSETTDALSVHPADARNTCATDTGGKKSDNFILRTINRRLFVFYSLTRDAPTPPTCKGHDASTQPQRQPSRRSPSSSTSSLAYCRGRHRSPPRRLELRRRIRYMVGDSFQGFVNLLYFVSICSAEAVPHDGRPPSRRTKARDPDDQDVRQNVVSYVRPGHVRGRRPDARGRRWCHLPCLAAAGTRCTLAWQFGAKRFARLIRLTVVKSDFFHRNTAPCISRDDVYRVELTCDWSEECV